MNCQKWMFVLIVVLLLSFPSPGQTSQMADKIQIAFLLDVSGSMDQLILKAKSQFWRLGNYLGTATKDTKKPTVEFAILVYGLDIDNDFSKILIDFNSDLDSVAMKLHEIEVGGGNEYCWTTIKKALDSLTWSNKKDDLKLIVIAGNESFNQEKVDSKLVAVKARKMNVIINAIYCSSYENDSIRHEWEQAAEQGKGSYFSISLNDSLNLKETFLDNKLSEFNDKLNETYIPFGPTGQRTFNRMILQDKNSKLAGIALFRERVMFKAGDSFKNPTWDLVDAINADTMILRRPEVLKEVPFGFHDIDQLKEFVDHKMYMRESYKEVIKLRYEMIQKYLGENQGDGDLNSTLKTIIHKEGHKRGFEFKNE